MSRLRAETIPAVTVPPRLNGLPIAITHSPSRNLSESPNFTALITASATSEMASGPRGAACAASRGQAIAAAAKIAKPKRPARRVIGLRIAPMGVNSPGKGVELQQCRRIHGDSRASAHQVYVMAGRARQRLTPRQPHHD